MMISAEIITAIGGLFSTVAGSLFSFSKGRSLRRTEINNEIISQYQNALNDLRNEFDGRIQRLQAEIDSLKRDVCYIRNCKKRRQ